MSRHAWRDFVRAFGGDLRAASRAYRAAPAVPCVEFVVDRAKRECKCRYGACPHLRGTIRKGDLRLSKRVPNAFLDHGQGYGSDCHADGRWRWKSQPDPPTFVQGHRLHVHPMHSDHFYHVSCVQHAFANTKGVVPTAASVKYDDAVVTAADRQTVKRELEALHRRRRS